VKIRRLQNAGATAGEYLEIDEGTAKLPDKLLKRTVAHELIHYYLHDNKAYHGARARDLRSRNGSTDCHGCLFQECCAAYGLRDGYAHEVAFNYQYICSCGWWLKSTTPRPHQIGCKSCGKWMVTPTEYKRLQKIAAIGSRTCPIKIENYVIRKVKRLA
jgi:predicted SprT family Zn-dependent metalloprotease